MEITRRGFLGSALATAALWAVQARAAAKRPPNVILILTDDQGSRDLGCYASPDLDTPNLDALADRGVRFTQFYVGAPVCSPSRAALLTGRCPRRAGLTTNAGGKVGLPPEEITLAERLKEAGYRTALFGKWHLGELPEMSPLAQGFDEFFGHKVGCIDNYSHFFYWQGPNRHDMWRNDAETHEYDGQYFPDLVVGEAVRFLEENRDRPFFLYLPLNAPHYPVQPPDRLRQRYAHLPEPRRSYAAFVSMIDEKVGEVVAKVDELGLREDTLIVFLSDHGHSVEERNHFGGGDPGPLRGHKFTLWEGGIRVPAIVSWPGRIPEGEVRDAVASSMDILPTVLEYAGLDPGDRRLDGRSLVEVLASADAPSPHNALHWERPDHWAVREGPWKLVYNGPETVQGDTTVPQEEYFLSNLDEDATETVNRAEDHPDTVRRLTALHEDWARTADDD